MPREIVLGNGSLTVALDREMRIRDFFFPRVGLENHVGGHVFRFGLWVDGVFSWLDNNEWSILMNYMPETLVSRCRAKNEKQMISLEVNDAVYSFSNLFLRKVAVSNLSDVEHEVRVFFSQDFHIYGEDTGDTVLYEPQINSIIHYKRKRYFLIDGLTSGGRGIHQFATGMKEAFGKEGTWRDAEDGELQGNPIAQGSVDSTISFSVNIKPKSTGVIYYWIACGTSMDEVKELDSFAQKNSVEQLLLETENYWSAWVNRQNLNLSLLPQEITRLFKTSLLVMRTHVDNHGGIISSCDSDLLQFNRDTYSYVWMRDSAICALAFDLAGFQEISRMFFKFCSNVISDKGYFMHKYWSDGSIGSSWHALIDPQMKSQLPVQLDETALVVYALWKHFQRYRDMEFISQVYSRLVKQPAEFMQNYVENSTGLPRASFDMWEEKPGVFTATTACIISALYSAAQFAKVFFNSKQQEKLSSAAMKMKEAMMTNLYEPKLQRFLKAIYENGRRDENIDSSLAFTFVTGALDPESPEVKGTLNAIFEQLWIEPGIGGLARYENDDYQRVSPRVKGNPWFICTLWLARWYIRTAKSREDLKKALDIFWWVVKHSLPSGILAEQLDPFDASPLSVSPLVWSHAEFVIAICEYIEKYNQVSQQQRSG